MPMGTSIFSLSLCVVLALFLSVEVSCENASFVSHYLVQKHERKVLVETDYGQISAVKITDGTRGPFHVRFITLEPNSLFLPVILHADMVFYVHTGSGTLSWADDGGMVDVNIKRGDIYRLHPGSAFYVKSSLDPERDKLRIYAIFSNTEDNIYEPVIGAYSSINDVVLGFDPKVLQAAFKVPEDVIQEIMIAPKPPAIIHAVTKRKKNILGEWQTRLLKAFLSSKDSLDSDNGKKKKKTYNIFKEDPDFKNCNGWSLTVGRHESHLLKDSNIGVFMVSLTKGSMLGPHWNPRATELAIVLQGEGMVRVICSSKAQESGCRNMRFRVKEGDLFVVPRYHPMAQLAFNNGSFVFMGFSASPKKNHPQFLVGKSSVLRMLDRDILAASFNVPNATIHRLLTPQKQSVILDCTSCAEEEESKMEEEIAREREEEERRKREEARRREEEERKREEEEARRREEEERRRREEEEARRREEEERRRREEQEEARRKREEEERREREEEEEEEARKREEEEEEERKREKEEEEARRQEEERKEREEEAMREQEEEARRQEEERKEREEEAMREQEEARRQEEERKREREEAMGEQEEARRQEKERKRREREEEEEQIRREEAAAREEEEARRQEDERQKRAEQEEEKAKI